MSRDKQNIKTTDWLIRGIPEEQLKREKREAIKEAEAELRDKQIEEMAKILCRDYSMGECMVDSFDCLEGHCSKRERIEALYNAGYRKASDVAEEIFAEIEKRLSMYSHLHRYAEEAKKVTEEFADGTPCEMSSVWDAIALHKNGWDDYETMCQLQENIQNIDKSRLLKEFEGDIAELKKKYTQGKAEIPPYVRMEAKALPATLNVKYTEEGKC